MEIVFTNTFEVPDIYSPIPAGQMIPSWYKETESYIGGSKVTDGNGSTTATIKRCMPVFDVMNSGYYLVTHTDLFIKQIAQDLNSPDKKSAWFEWPSFNPISFHPPKQAELHPESTGSSIPKWINPWGIKTPDGYSCLFIPPVHRENIFVALPGVVDTDTYTPPVNIIFTLKDLSFEGLVPAGTPIVQVIPFKRDEWSMRIGNEQEVKDQAEATKKLRTRFFDSYKSTFRQPKEYR